MKVCKKCGLAKDFSEYFKHPTSRDRLQPYCKQCKNEVRRATPARLAERARRRASTHLASWDDKADIERLYALRREVEELTGVKYHVDHIDPLTHPLVCGLHTVKNLRVVPASLNLEKHNKFTPYRVCNGVRYELREDGEWE